MADYEFYPVGVSSEVARDAIVAAADVAKTAGILRGDGNGHVSIAEAGVDFGYPVLLGNGPPTQFVAGEIGQFYYNRVAASAPYIYVCVDYTSQGYQWQVLGGAGSGFVILGYYDTLDRLQSSVTNPAAGDAYGVGTAEPYTIYVFDGITHTWKNNGTLGVGGVSTGIPPHGTTGQALVKASAASGDVKWATITTTPADGSITAAKLAGGAVTEPKYGDVSIPTRAYKAASVTRAKLANDALYSPLTKPTAVSYSIAGTDIGKTIVDAYGTRDSALTWTMSKSVADAYPVGTEIAFARSYNTQSISIKITGARMILKAGGQIGGASTTVTLKLPERGSMCALKKLEDDATYGSFWILTGDVEVAS